MTAPTNSVQPQTLSGWREWLAANHSNSTGVWLIAFKKTSGKQRFTLDQAIEEALCFGWIDSKPAKLDPGRTMLWFSPRKPKSGWSLLNKRRVERLTAQGRMTKAGLLKVEAAKSDGSWSKLDSVEELVIPRDLARAFSRHPGSRRNFEAFPRSVKRGILEWIIQAKQVDTRARRIEQTARLARDNQRANQWQRRGWSHAPGQDQQ